ERTAFAITAGVDLNCQRGRRDQFNYANTMSEAIDREIETLTGTFNENDVDNALVRLFTERIKLGEFDDVDQVPWVQEARARVPQGTWVNDESNGAITQTPERLALAREVAGESIVLLKNSNDLLPL